jgi:hypothetical protein
METKNVMMPLFVKEVFLINVSRPLRLLVKEVFASHLTALYFKEKVLMK